MKQYNPILTVIIPLYNEVATIACVLDAVNASPYSKQIIVVDDGSRDGSFEEVVRWIEQSAETAEVELLRHRENRGKGSAIMTALPHARGRVALVQDADLECNPAEYPKLVEPILNGIAAVVFGSRYLVPEWRSGWSTGRTFVCLANALVWILFGKRISDEAGCYKVMPTELLRSLDLRCKRFEFCPEVVAKLCRLGVEIHEVPVRYAPRDNRAGKKIGWRDAIEAVVTLLWWRVAPWQRSSSRGSWTHPFMINSRESAIGGGSVEASQAGSEWDTISTHKKSIFLYIKQIFNKNIKYISIILLLIHAGLLFGNLRWNFIVVDEVAHVPSGVSHWQTGSFCLDRVNPPMPRMVAALPVLIAGPKSDYHQFDASQGIRREWQVGKDFIAANGRRSFDLIRLARLPGIVWSLLGGWLVYRWARELYGEGGGLLALTVWCFDPTILAFAPVVTPDLPSAVAALVAMWAFRHYLQRGCWSTAALAGLALGFALLVKHTLVLLFGIMALLWFIKRFRWMLCADRVMLQSELCKIMSIFLIGVCVLNSGYGFHGTGRSLGDYKFVSRLFTLDGQVRNRFQGTSLSKIPVPLPEDYLLGIDLQRKDFEGTFHSYLNGRWSDHGWWYYYLEALALKEPLGYWLLGLWGTTLILTRHVKTSRFQEELYLLIPVMVIMGFVSSQTGFNHHMRYVMPMFPFWIIGLGKLAHYFRPGHSRAAAAISALLAWSIVSSLSVYPHSLSYFNELAGGPKNGHLYLLDSNIDWGQDLLYLRDWLQSHPEAQPLGLAYFNAVDPRPFGIDYYLPPLARSSLLSRMPDPEEQKHFNKYFYFAISINLIMGKRFDIPDGHGNWENINNHYLFDYFKYISPIERIGYSIYIYRLTPEMLESWHHRQSIEFDGLRNGNSIQAEGH
jgi:glycosyltransferase involved in cell wall biosynthesis